MVCARAPRRTHASPLARTQDMRPDGGLALAAALWLCSQLYWLAVAYRLEFLGHDVFEPLWRASVAFFAANAWLLARIVRARPVMVSAAAAGAPGTGRQRAD